MDLLIYNSWWEEDTESTYDKIELGYEEPVIIEQKIINSREIDLSEEVDYIDFPWGGHSYEDFEHLTTKMEECLSISMKCKSVEDVVSFKNKYRDVYKGYFQRPICVYFEKRSGKYSFGCDGRHRIFVAQRQNALIPVWVVEYKEIKRLTLEQYMKRQCYGEWRFFGIGAPID